MGIINEQFIENNICNNQRIKLMKQINNKTVHRLIELHNKEVIRTFF